MESVATLPQLGSRASRDPEGETTARAAGEPQPPYAAIASRGTLRVDLLLRCGLAASPY